MTVILQHATTGHEGETEPGVSEHNDQPGQNQELVPKRGTASVAWSRVFKHCSFNKTDFNRAMCRLCFCERSAHFLPL